IVYFYLFVRQIFFFLSTTMSNKLTNKVLLNEPQNALNELINRNDLNVKTTELLNELLETTKIIENCTSCKDKKIDGNDLDKIKNCLAELEKKEQEQKRCYIIDELNQELFEINIRLNNEILCEGCKGKEIEKLTDKYGDEKIARFLYYQCKLNAGYYDEYIRWIPFDEFKNIEYLAKGGFGEVHKATWINGYYDWYEIYEMKYYNRDVVLKRIYNNSSDDKIVDILNEVK